MKSNFLFSLEFDILSFLSLFFFLLSDPHLTAPLGLFFLLSIFNEITFIGASFGIAIVAIGLSVLTRKARLNFFLRFVYCIAALSCIAGVMITDITMFKEVATQVSLIVFLLFNIPMAIKWGFEIFRQHNKQQLHDAGSVI